MKNKKYKLLLVIFVLLTLFVTYELTNKSEIDKILLTDEYSYLPKEAQIFIKDEYEKTGNVILTEKNKKEGVGYLNPNYVKYLSLSSEDKSKEDIIPMPTIVEYSSSEEVNKELPSKYDLRDIDGKRYLTLSRNQGPLGICWSFATTSLLESHILNKNNTPYTNNSITFSDRHFDYITASDSIKDYTSEYTSYFNDRLLGTGGNFYITTEVLASGVGAVDYNDFKSNYENEKLELNEVINYSKSLYEVNRTFNMESLNIRNEENNTKKENYLNTIKSYIMEYGGAYVSTTSPQSGCAYFDINAQNYVIDNDSACTTSNHAMEIIGWDDDVEYSYCKTNPYNHDGITATCASEDIVTGKGVWILKNSWGEDSSHNYPYLTYNSSETDYNFIVDVNTSDKRKWDNNYIVNYQDRALGTSETEFELNNIDIKGNEILNKIKFIVYNKDFDFDITITTGSNSKTYTLKDYEPGLVTLDLYSEDIIINSNTKILVSGGSDLFYNTLYVFTNNIDDTKYLSLSNLEITDNNSKRLYSITKNIPSNSKIEYKLYNSNGTDVSNSIEVSNNIVGANKVNTLINFPNLLSGEYTLKTIYNNEQISSCKVDIKRDDLSKLIGDGTKDNPYIISSGSDLYLLNSKDINADYITLDNDIDLKEINWTPIEGFKGYLDGGNHTIKNLNITADSAAGLFKNLDSGATITNIILEDFNIKGNISGALVSEVSSNDVTIKNIAIKNSNIEGEYAGSLIGKLDGNNSTVENIFTDSYITGINTGGLAGIINNANIKNIEVLGSIVGDNSSIIASVTNKVNIENIISTVTDINREDDLDKIISNRTETNISNYKLYDKDITVDNSVFNDWTDFNDNFKIEIIDEIERIPVLKFVNIDYIKLTDKELTLKTTDKINIYDYLTPNKNSHKRKLSFTGVEINSDGIINLKDGLNEINIINMYDGGNYIFKINVEIPKYIVRLNPNGADGDIKDINVTMGVEEQLPENVFIKEGYTFDSWNTKEDGTGEKISSLNFDVKEGEIVDLYAIWKGNNINVTFNVNDGDTFNENTCKFTLTDNNCQKEVVVGSLYGQLPVPTREEYKFLGWYTSLENGTLVTDKDIVTNNLVLYAIWEKEDYDISKSIIEDIPEQSYTSKLITPKLKITNNGEELKLNTDYIVSYLNNKNVGTATINIKGIGKYKGETTKTFKIVIDIPKKLTISDKTTTSITLKWSKPTGKVTGYQLYMSTSKNGKYTKIATTSKTSYKKTKLIAGKTYYFKIRIYYKTKDKNYYSDYVVLESSTALSKPSIAASRNTSTIKVNYNKVSGATGYEIYLSTDKKIYTKVGDTKELSYKITSLNSAKSYYVKVRAYKMLGDIKIKSSCSKVLRVTTKPLTPVIENSALNYNYITIKWNKISSVTGYEIYRSTNGKTYTKIKTINSVMYKDTNLNLGTSYYYKVRAYKTVSGKKVYGSFSNILELKPRLVTPTINTTYNDNSIIISYNKISGASGYQIYKSEDGEDYKLLKTTSAISYIDTDIEEEKTYYYKVRAYRKISKTYYYSYLSSYSMQKIIIKE